MKIFNILGSVALALTVMTSCAVHDPFADKGDLGQVVPTVDWEQASTVVKAGSYASFTAKYYTSSDHQIDSSAVWALTKRSRSAAATSKLTSALAYTKTYAVIDTVRTYARMAGYPHSAASWDGHEFELVDSFPTSRTLKPLAWATPTEWDQATFDNYYPSTFAQEFCDYMVTALTKNNTYYNDLVNVYVKYDFTKEQFEALNAKYGLNFPTDVESDKKSDDWFTTDEVDHYYYTTVVDSATVAYHEIATQAEAPQGANVYPVYKSSAWLFSRYSDDTGGKVTTVRDEYIPYFKDLLSLIPFTGWIYNTADKNYTVNYSCTYYLEPRFEVYDDNGKKGVTTDNKEITLN